MGKIKQTWDDFVSGKISYSNFSESALVMAVNISAETYDLIIGDREPLTNGVADPAKIYRGVKSSIPFSTMSFNIGEAVLVGYLAGDRNNPLVIGRSDNIVMDIEKVSINPLPPRPGTEDIFIFDGSNYRIKRHSRAAGLGFVMQQGGFQGYGQDQYQSQVTITTDGSYVYLLDRIIRRLTKRRLDDLTFVASRGTYGTGPGQFIDPRVITTDGTYIYIFDDMNNGASSRITKFLSADLSYVAEVSGVFTYTSIPGITTDGTYLYISASDWRESENIKRFRSSDLVYEAGLDLNIHYPTDIESDGVSLWVVFNGSGGGIRKYNPSTFALEAEIVFAFNDPFYPATQITVDDLYVYTGSALNFAKYSKIGFGTNPDPDEGIQTPSMGLSGPMDFYGIQGLITGNFINIIMP